MKHGGEIYNKIVENDFSVSLNPNPCPKELFDAGVKALQKADRYPDIEQGTIRRELAWLEGFSPEEIICGNGASELIMAVIRNVSPKRAVILAPSFAGYEHCLGAISSKIERYSLSRHNDFKLDMDFISRITDDTDMVILANPNNPTGLVIDVELLNAIFEKCQATNTKLMIDECFLELSDRGKSLTDKIKLFDGLYILKAFTKLFSIPGIRFGYLISQKKNIDEIKKILPEWNLSIVAEKMAIEGAKILKDSDFVKNSRQIILAEREYLKEELNGLGIITFPSDANYILIYCNEIFDGQDLYEALLNDKTLIRDAQNFEGLSKGYYRIGLKDHAANERLINMVKKLYADRTR